MGKIDNGLGFVCGGGSAWIAARPSQAVSSLQATRSIHPDLAASTLELANLANLTALGNFSATGYL